MKRMIEDMERFKGEMSLHVTALSNKVCYLE